MLRKFSDIPLRYTFPALIIIFFFSASVWIAMQEIIRSNQRIEDEKSEHVRTMMHLLQSVGEHEYWILGKQGIDDLIAVMAPDENIKLLVFSDENNKILSSSARKYNGHTLESIIFSLAQDEYDLIKEKIKSRLFAKERHFNFNASADRITALYPVNLTVGKGKLRNLRTGYFFMIYDLKAITAESNRQILYALIWSNIVLILIAVVLIRLFNVHLTRRLNNLITVTDRFGNGDLSSRSHISGKDEIGKLGSTFNLMADRIVQLAFTDYLTGAQNRRSFEVEVNSNLRKPNFKGALLYLDLDGFKEINDTSGHSTGDKMLKEIAQRLSVVTGKESLLARIGGDEFAIFMRNRSDNAHLEKFAMAMLEAIVEDFSHGGQEFNVTASIGVALYPEDGLNFEELLRHADAAMYESKKLGKNRVSFFSQKLLQQINLRAEISQALRKAIQNNEFTIYHQPIIDAKTGNLHGIECLLRWQNEKFKYLGPADFIPIIEETGNMNTVGEWVLMQAVADFLFLKANGLDVGSIHVNVAPVQLQSKGFISFVRNLVTANNLADRELCLELTESGVMKNAAENKKMLQELQELGVGIAIDDFGTGYSSLSYLKHLPIDILKIDKSFVDDLITDEDDEAIIKAIVSLGRALELEIVAEGVENSETVAKLSAMGCHILQGYFFAKPVSRDALLEIFNTSRA